MGIAVCAWGAVLGPSPVDARAAQPAAAVRPIQSRDAPSSDSPERLFLERVAEYVELHKNATRTVPALTETSDPAKITAREVALGVAVMRARATARQGDVFVPAYRPVIERIVRREFAARSLADRQALTVELPRGVVVRVNAVYPTELPLATFPANLLTLLPELPPELEYRIVGRDLILRDTAANLVVDLMPNVFPIPTR